MNWSIEAIARRLMPQHRRIRNWYVYSLSSVFAYFVFFSFAIQLHSVWIIYFKHNTEFLLQFLIKCILSSFLFLFRHISSWSIQNSTKATLKNVSAWRFLWKIKIKLHNTIKHMQRDMFHTNWDWTNMPIYCIMNSYNTWMVSIGRHRWSKFYHFTLFW